MPEVTRRTVLTAGGLAVAAGLLRAAPASAATVPARATFESLVGTRVVVHTPAGNVPAVVDAVNDVLGAPSGSPKAFSVLFRVSGAKNAPDGTYRISGSRLGNVTLFVANVNTGSAARLQAIVNTIAY
jgi:hypothetical protein